MVRSDLMLKIGIGVLPTGIADRSPKGQFFSNTYTVFTITHSYIYP